MAWLLALDMGTNSLGWWAYEVQKDNDKNTGEERWRVTKSLDGGVRIFSNGRTGKNTASQLNESLASVRRTARGKRRNRDRQKNRRQALIKHLTSLGLLPRDQAERDRLFQSPKQKKNTKCDPEQSITDLYNPYRLRAAAASEKVEAYELGRALQHLGARRGYFSNRKEPSDKEGGELKEKISNLDNILNGQTLGSYLWDSYQAERLKPGSACLSKKTKPVRFSERNDFFASREMYRHEFKTIRQVQEKHYSLSEDDWDTLSTYILDQRPLKPVERGRCRFFTDQKRHWNDTPAGHNFRLYQELNNLRLIMSDLSVEALTKDQYQAILILLKRQQTVSFDRMRKERKKDKAKNLLFPEDSRFNIESPKRKKLKGHSLRSRMEKNKILKPVWDNYYKSNELDDMIAELFEAETDEIAIKNLEKDYCLSREQAKEMAKLPLSRATSRLSLKALRAITEIMRDKKLPYHEAVTHLKDKNGQPLHHSTRLGETYDRLPYYGEVMQDEMMGAHPDIPPEESVEKHFGRIGNPTVHIGLNQIGLLVNTLVERFGSAPVKIHLEVIRDLKQSKDQINKTIKIQKDNQKENDRIRKILSEEHKLSTPSARDIKKYKLWEELGENKLERLCPFTGKNIAANQLLNGEVEIEHILPFSRTLDDSFSNLTLSYPWANKLKGNKSPYEAFGTDHHKDQGICWQDIINRIDNLPKNKKIRFGKNAMERFTAENDFIARQLTDTAYISKVAARYLKSLKGVEDVISIPGRLTAMIRGKWKLNDVLSEGDQKSRDDHRHHALDAAIIGLTDRALLQSISTHSSREGENNRLHIHLPSQPPVLDCIRQRIPWIIPSTRPRHKFTGRFFKESAYGIPQKPEEKEDTRSSERFIREKITDLSLDKIKKISDESVKKALLCHLRPLIDESHSKAKLKKALEDFSLKHGIIRIRLKTTSDSVLPVKSAPYKGYLGDDYICCDIWKIPPAKKGGKAKYKGVYWRYDQALRDKDNSLYIDKNAHKPHPAAAFITRLFKRDMVQIGPLEDGYLSRNLIFEIYGFSATNNMIDLRPPHLAESKQIFKSINTLGLEGIRRLHITPDGRVLYRRLKP